MEAGNEDYITDLVSFLCPEAYATQMRACSCGSDGLAEPTPEDSLPVTRPSIPKPQDIRLERARLSTMRIDVLTMLDIRNSPCQRYKKLLNHGWVRKTITRCQGGL
jgi:hypothetical protein